MKIIIPVSRLRRLTFWILCFFLFSISNVFCQDPAAEPQTTPSPRRQPQQNFVTGKLNQFNGFYTPRPLPSNANFVYASIWASWSAWSFCANNVQIRVRACNTVRGFTCPGANQERKPCGQAAVAQMRQRQRNSNNNNNGFGGDYDAVDPWEEDRKEALKQLYSDYTPPDEPQRPPAPPLRGLGKSLKPSGDFAAVQRSAGRTAFGGNNINGYGSGPIAPLRPPPEHDFHRKFHADGPGQAPSMTPELLFGSKLEIPAKRIKSSSSESKEQRLEGISAERKEEFSTGITEHQTSEITQEVPITSTASNAQETTITITENEPSVDVEMPIEVPVEGKFVPSTETNQNPLKMGMNHEVAFGMGPKFEKGGVMEDITKNHPTTMVEAKNGEDFGDESKSAAKVNTQDEGEIFGEAAVTDILPRVEATTQISLTVPLEVPTTPSLSNFESETEDSASESAPALHVLGDSRSKASDANIENAETDLNEKMADLNTDEFKAEQVTPEFHGNFPLKSQPLPSQIPPHAAFEHEDDDSDLMAPTSNHQQQQPQQQQEHQSEQQLPPLQEEEAPLEHFQQPTIKISPSKSQQQPIPAREEQQEPLPKDEMYDDQFEAQNTRTTVSPEDKIKQLEADMDALETQITQKLHSGEVSFNKDTEKALEWMLANMTKAAEEAAERQEKLEAEKKIKEKKNHHHHTPPVHSGEISYPNEAHEGESKGIFGKAQILDNRQFAAKISPMDSPITLRKIQPEIQKQHYDSLKYQHAKVIKPIQLKVKPEQSPEANLLEKDLKKLRAEMAKMESELVALQGDTSIVEVKNERTTIGPNLKAIDLELVPKGPKPVGGPNTPIVSIGNDGEMFLLDVPSEKGEAQWSPWRSWGDCFCDKQIRTRICNYDSAFHSKGCQGKSFESRPCVTSRPCPAKTALKQKQARTTPNPLNSDGLYTLAPHKGPRNGYAFKPNPLSVAISSSSSASNSQASEELLEDAKKVLRNSTKFYYSVSRKQKRRFENFFLRLLEVPEASGTIKKEKEVIDFLAVFKKY